MTETDDLIPLLADAVPPLAGAEAARPWRILLVDDDADVHESTAFALRSMQIMGRPLQLLHAHSAAEGLHLLRQTPDMAVILLDVVMESEHAGLEMVARVREELGMLHTRIVLRTGQPGQAPELETITRYDINDYRTKAELTRHKLCVTLTTSVRSYDQLRRLDASRSGLEKVVAASNQFIAEQGMVGFAEGVILQIAGLLGVDPEGLLCASMDNGTGALVPIDELTVIAAAGRWRHLINHRLSELVALGADSVAQRLRQCLGERRQLCGPGFVTLFFPGRGQQDFAAYIAAHTPLPDVDQQLLEVFCTNITLCAANVALVNRLREHAYVDRLLGIANRTAMIEALDASIQSRSLSGQTLVQLDIDQFVETNDLFGHRFGDLVLQALSDRLRSLLPPPCLVARVGGNSFALLGPAAALQPGPLREALDHPVLVDGAPRRLSLSMGFVRCDQAAPRHGHELLQDATLALKRAKATGQGRSEVYTAAIGTDAKARTRLLHGLHRALDQERLFLMFQPQLELGSNQVLGVEALMRWRADDGQLVPPDSFIPLAEQSGLIVAMGAWGLARALASLAELDRLNLQRLQMAVNVSAVQLAHPDFLRQLDAALSEAQVPANRLELEVTESVGVVGLERVAGLLAQVRERGVGVAIDDFGTGFSSLSYLDGLPADRLKIDRSFVRLLDSDRPGARIARMIVPLGHQLGLRVLAEGVETDSQLAALREMGCDEAQGFHFARPMALPELCHWLVAHPGTLAS